MRKDSEYGEVIFYHLINFCRFFFVSLTEGCNIVFFFPALLKVVFDTIKTISVMLYILKCIPVMHCVFVLYCFFFFISLSYALFVIKKIA